MKERLIRGLGREEEEKSDQRQKLRDLPGGGGGRVRDMRGRERVCMWRCERGMRGWVGGGERGELASERIGRWRRPGSEVLERGVSERGREGMGRWEADGKRGRSERLTEGPLKGESEGAAGVRG